MPLDGYGALAARALGVAREDGTAKPHYQVHLVDDAGLNWRIAVNVESQVAPSELLYLVVEDFLHPVTAQIESLGSGWHALEPGVDAPHLDYIRGNLFDRARLRLLPPALAGPDNDLADLLDGWLHRAIADPAVTVYAFGQRFGPAAGVTDAVFGFSPSNGVHDIHMNQGNAGRFAADNGVRQDGALLLHFPAPSRWVAIFLAFQSQSFHTDDVTGHSLEEPAAPAAIRIIAAMVNPVGPTPEVESVLLLNTSPAPVDLTGWRIADRARQTCPVPGGPLGAGETRRVPVAGSVVLGNGGGTVTLLNTGGQKVDGVAYTAADAAQEGWTVTF